MIEGLKTNKIHSYILPQYTLLKIHKITLIALASL